MPTHSLYGGRVKVEFDEDAHIYDLWVDGENIGQRDSVTKILKAVDMGKSDAFAWWAAGETCDSVWDQFTGGRKLDELPVVLDEAVKAHAQTRDEAAEVGRQVHAWLEAHINAVMTFSEDPPLPENEEERNAVLAYLSHEQERGVSYEDNERIVYSLEHDYIGTLDHTRLFVADGKLSLGDYKSAADMRISFRLQLAAYAKALMEEHPDKVIEKRYIYILGKDKPDCRVVDLKYDGLTDAESLEWDFQGFLAAQKVWKWGLKALEAQPKKKRKKGKKERKWH